MSIIVKDVVAVARVGVKVTAEQNQRDDVDMYITNIIDTGWQTITITIATNTTERSITGDMAMRADLHTNQNQV